MSDYDKWLKSKQDEGCRGLKLRDTFEGGQRDMLEKVTDEYAANGHWDFSSWLFRQELELDQLAKELGDEIHPKKESKGR